MFSHFSQFFLTHRFFRQEMWTLPFLVFIGSFVLLTIGSFGCSESDDQATADRQESPSPTVQETPENQQTVSSPSEKEQEESMADTKQIQAIREEVHDQLAKANNAVEKAEELLQRAPTGKGSDLALAALQQELESAHSLLQISQSQFDDQKFELARAQAGQAKDKADKVTQQIEQAIDTVKLHSP